MRSRAAQSPHFNRMTRNCGGGTHPSASLLPWESPNPFMTSITSWVASTLSLIPTPCLPDKLWLM